MLRILVGALGTSSRSLLNLATQSTSNVISKQTVQPTAIWRNYSSFLFQPSVCNNSSSLLAHSQVEQIANNITRSVTKFSIRKGQRKSVKPVLKRFYRLNWGIWIRTKCGRNKRKWTKSSARLRRLRQHVFCNATQSKLLDKMVSKFWKKPKYYVEDPYEPYHTREEFKYTYKKPKPYFPPENV